MPEHSHSCSTDLDLATFRRLCERFADEIDGTPRREAPPPAERELLEFCHKFAYECNGVVPWR